MSLCVQGAWTRQSMAIGGGEGFETQHVYWLQAGPCYADLRVPFHPAAAERCFAGRSAWEGDDQGRLRWTHRLDLERANPEDVGELAWEGGQLIERGWFGTDRYEELWVRLDDGKGPFLAAEGRHGCLVQVGCHAITVVDDRAAGGSFAACYRVCSHSGWETHAAIGDSANLPSPAAIPADWRRA